MIIKFKRKRRIWINSISLLIVISFFYTIWNFIVHNSKLLLFITFVFQALFWLGMVYYQAAKYTGEKIMAQFGWPTIDYTDIISVETKFGDLLIKSEKREIVINKDVVDEESLKKFLALLETKLKEGGIKD